MKIETAFAARDVIYLSGPISSCEPAQNVSDNIDTFTTVGVKLMKYHGADVTVMNPTILDQELDYDEMMRRDYHMLIGCSHILMLPNWQYSKGACSELLLAVQLKIKVRYLLHDLDTVIKRLSDCNVVKETMMQTIGKTITCL